MSFLSRIKDFFSQKKSTNSEQLSINNNQLPTDDGLTYDNSFQNQNSELRTVTNAVQNSEFSTLNSEPPYWLSNEDALRDEGVIFGLSETKPDEKISTIKTFFLHQTADLEQEVGVLNEKIGELNLFLEQKELRIEELNSKIKTLNEHQSSEHSMLRTVVGLILSVAMCAGNFYLIDESITKSFPQNHSFIALGVFLAGMFNLFGNTSFLHEKNTSISFRQILEEVGMPFAASIFVFVQAFENQSLIKSLALFLFVFFLFLFAGKLMLSNLSLIKKDSQNWLFNLNLKSSKINKTKYWEEEILNLKSEMDDLRIRKWQIINELKSPEAELARLNGKRDMLIKLFESEFNLAKNYKEKLTSNQMRRILE